MTDIASQILAWLLSVLMVYKYFALFTVGFIAAAVFPLPATTLLVAASAFASQGYFNIYAVIATTFAANILGDIAGLFLSRLYGEKFIRAVRLGKVLDSKKYHDFRKYILSKPLMLVFFTRFMTEANSVVNVIAGLTRMPLRRYFPPEIAGQILYIALCVSGGWYLGETWEDNISLVSRGAMFVIALGVFFNVVQFLLFKYRKK
jgi:membrane protein DedA with SNARE-associated domain